MARNPAQSTSWVANKMRTLEGGGIEAIIELTPYSFQISRHNGPPFVVGVISAARVELHQVQQAFATDANIEFITNIPKESMWTGDAIDFANVNMMAWGGVGDLMRAVRLDDPREYIPSETQFIERTFRQHDRVMSFNRLADRLYQINRRAAPSLVVAVLNEYELTGDRVRAAWDTYGRFELIGLSNPNGGPTEQAIRVAEALGVEILKWGPLLGRFNSQ